MNIEKLRKELPLDLFLELSSILKTRVISKTQLCHLLSNCDVESQRWTKFEENLNYRPARLLQIFPKYVKSLADATQLCKAGPRAIAERVYGGRMGNRRGTSDAFDCRGSGPLMITGRNNFLLFDATVPDDIDKNRDLMRTKYKLSTAFWFFDVNKIWVEARYNNPATETSLSSIQKVRRKVNGGFIGLADVQKAFSKYYSLIS